MTLVCLDQHDSWAFLIAILMEALWNIKHDSTLVCSIGLFALRRSSLSTTSPVALIEELSLLLVSDSLIIEIVPPLQVLFR